MYERAEADVKNNWFIRYLLLFITLYLIRHKLDVVNKTAGPMRQTQKAQIWNPSV